jgi:hypothetical protein
MQNNDVRFNMMLPVVCIVFLIEAPQLIDVRIYKCLAYFRSIQQSG